MGRAFIKPENVIVEEMFRLHTGPGANLLARGKTATKIANDIAKQEFKYLKPSYPFAQGKGPHHYQESWDVYVDQIPPQARLGVKILNFSEGGIFAEQGRPAVEAKNGDFLAIHLKGGGYARVRRVRAADGHAIIGRAVRIAYS